MSGSQDGSLIHSKKNDFSFGISLGLHYLSPLENLLSLEKAQINLAFCSLIRNFAAWLNRH